MRVVSNIFDPHICDNERAALLNFFEISNGYAFCFFIFFQNERNITTSLLMTHLKCTVVHYAKLNSSSKNKPILNYGCWICYFVFFAFLFMSILIKLLSKNIWNNSFLKQNIRTSNLVILKCDINAKFEKIAPFL